MIRIIIRIILKLVVVIVVVAFASTINPLILLLIVALMTGLISTAFVFAVFLAIAPIFKQLVDDPDMQRLLTLYVAVEPGRTVTIMREGNLDHFLHGKDDRRLATFVFDEETFTNPYLHKYDMYVFRKFGVRFVGIPFIHSIRYKGLLRYKLVGEGNQKKFMLVKAGDPGYYTNHVRTRSNPWYYEWEKVDIEGIPFTVRGAAYYRINPNKVREANFDTSAWDEQLNLAVNREGRQKLRSTMTIAKAIGIVNSDIWKDTLPETAKLTEVGDEIMEAIKGYKFKNPEDGITRTLEAFGIDILHFDIIDFDPELDGDALKAFQAPTLARRLAQARELEGKGERAYQEEVLAALASQPDLAEVMSRNKALVDAVKGGGEITTLITALIQGLQKK